MPICNPRLFITLAFISALSACSNEPDKNVPPFVSMQEYLKTAYQPATHFKFEGWTAQWAWAGNQVNTALLVPSGQRNVPVVLYLPGLGEDASAGELWRQSWADAGYAVLSVQATRDDHSLYSSTDAQAGAFRNMAMKAFGDKALNTRLEEVQQVLAEAQRRGQAGEAGFSALDTHRVVVAGYDLGAQTAAALAGERAPGQPRSTALRPMAAISLSPYVPGGADFQRYAQVDVPLLAVTGVGDEDPFSWIETPEQRQNLYTHLSGSGYQLLLNDVTHAGLSGNFFKAADGKHAPANRGESQERNKPGGGHRHGGKPGGGGGEVEPGFDPHQAATIATVSTAFLDATVKQSATAQQWLTQQAPGWLAEQGRLMHK